MLFKQLSVYQIDLTAWSLDDGAARLEAARFMPAIASAWSSEGWIPLDGLEDLMYLNQDYCWLGFCKEEKILPATVIRDALMERIATIEAQEGRSLGRKEIRSLKDELALTLLPNAFRKKKKIWAYLDLKRHLLMVNAVGAPADALVGLLTKSWPHLPVRLQKPKTSLTESLTQALIDGALPDGFSFDMDCEMKDPSLDAAFVRCRKMSLYAPELQYHLSAGKKVTQIGLVWQDKLHFLLTEDAIIKRFKLIDHDDEPLEANPDQRLAASCFITQSILSEFYDAFATAFLSEYAPD